LNGRLAKVATAPNATGTTRKKITVDDWRKTYDGYSRNSDLRVLRLGENLLKHAGLLFCR